MRWQLARVKLRVLLPTVYVREPQVQQRQRSIALNDASETGLSTIGITMTQVNQRSALALPAAAEDLDTR